MSKNKTISAQFHEEVALFIKGYGEKRKIEGKEYFQIPYCFRKVEDNVFEVVEVENPIKNNRIVNDKTFATRFVGFLSDIQIADAISYDELEYLKYVAKKLLDY